MANEYEFSVTTEVFGELTFKVLSIGEKARLQSKARAYDPLNPESPELPNGTAFILAELDTALVGNDLAVDAIIDDEAFWGLWEAYVTARDSFRQGLGKHAVKTRQGNSK